MQNKYDRPVIVFSSKKRFNNYFPVSYGKSNPRNGILNKNWFKEIIIDDIGVSEYDGYHQSSYI